MRMNKETKIGLLVGLTFVIIVGILLGDTVRTSSSVPHANVAKVADSVRSGVLTPGGQNSPPITMQDQEKPRVTAPQQPVPTHDEVGRPQGGIVYVGPGEMTPNHLMANSPNSATGGNGNSGNTGNTPQSGDPLHQLARQNGEELQPVGPRGADNNSGNRPGHTQVAGKTYQVSPGDNLSKIAAKFYGSGAKMYRDAIIAANPSLQKSPDRVIIGQTYVIPAIETSQPVAQTPPTPAPLPASRGGGGSPATTEYFYTVKENDSLWRIARDQCGDPKAVNVLKELNKDVLKDGETVRVNMKLRLPGKPAGPAH